MVAKTRGFATNKRMHKLPAPSSNSPIPKNTQRFRKYSKKKIANLYGFFYLSESLAKPIFKFA
jgi:hypothetical protein